MNRRLAAAALAAIPIIMVSACTKTTTTGNPTPATEQGGTTSTSSPTGKDLNISRFTDRPCELVKPEQLSTLGKLKTPKQEVSILGPTCTWPGKDPTADNTYALTLVTKGSTFESMRENVKDRPIFKDTTVAGREAYSSDATNGTRDCGTTVKTSGKDAVLIQMTLGDEDTARTGKSCRESEKLAEIVIKNLAG
ncbi:hypothetical protein GCM10022243_15480 [Saccharothrix violaceirubra]|uniref:DUF3558 domain-containing protein n=1 Tax=Saccharothrix violaceirubra TaxID=413306 RepID=A0A7W7T6E9_9PSEU|nr:DUF3558 domain-containing protein [Saccharothrix violaceirubra]MBB4967424.1 hypothetical protein [Saccharothrix violaceirubra]